MSDAAPSNRGLKLALVATIVVVPLVSTLGAAWASHSFPDVPPSNIFHDEIGWGAEHGIINGYTNGKFGPNDNVNRGQAAAFLSHYNDAIHTVTTDSNPPAASNWIFGALCPIGERAIGGWGEIGGNNIYTADTWVDVQGRRYAIFFETEGNVQMDPTTSSVTAVCAPNPVG